VKTIILICSLLVSLHLQAQIAFALLTDLHVSPGDANDRALSKIIHEINESGIPVVIITGDITNQGSNAELANVKEQLDKLTKPYYIIPGNHETTWSESACKEYFRLFGNDRFCFKTGNLLFVGFDTGPYMKMGDGHVKQEDLIWLEQTLSKEHTENLKVYSFAHYPLSEGELGNWREVVNILKTKNCVVSFCGHGHAYKELTFGNLKGIMLRSMFLKDTVTAGYSLIKLMPDSVFVYEKILNEPQQRRFAFATGESSNLPAIPDKEEKQVLPPNVMLTLFYQDNASVFTGVASDKERIFFGNSLGEIKAVSKQTAKCVWSFPTGYSLYSTPCYSDGKVIFPAVNNHIYALNANDGTIEWEIRGTAPFVADGLVHDGKIYQGGYKKFYKIDIATGTVEWCFDSIKNYCQAQPVYANGKTVFGAWDTNLYCLDSSTGQLQWKWNNGKEQNLFSPANGIPVFHDEKVFIVAPDRYMTAINLSDGKEVWRSNKYQVRESQGISEDGKTVYAKLMDGNLLAVSAEGDAYNPLWTVDSDLGYEHAPCPVLEYKGVIYLGSRNGMVVAVDAKTHRVIWRYKCGNSGINRFYADAGGTIYFTLIEGKIFKLEVR
jgi:outer membrane protein assembly factor BamB/predicted phosphohydrolase